MELEVKCLRETILQDNYEKTSAEALGKEQRKESQIRTTFRNLRRELKEDKEC